MNKKQSAKIVRKRAERLRLGVQILLFALILLISINHGLGESGKSIPVLSAASLHAVCPFGGVVSIYQYIGRGVFVQKVHESSFILMIIVFLLAILFGPVFCGWICPFGSFQEWLGKIGRKIFKKKYNRFLPYAIDKWLRFLRYLLLAWVVYMTAVSGKLIFADIDPYFALFNFWSGEAAIGGLIILGVVIILSIFVERPFCKYACPYGAVLGIFNLVRIFKIRRNEQTCTNCGACDRACPMNIEISKVKAVLNHQCITCLKCTSEQACPVGETIELTPARLITNAEEAKA